MPVAAAEARAKTQQRPPDLRTFPRSRGYPNDEPGHLIFVGLGWELKPELAFLRRRAQGTLFTAMPAAPRPRGREVFGVDSRTRFDLGTWRGVSDFAQDLTPSGDPDSLARLLTRSRARLQLAELARIWSFSSPTRGFRPISRLILSGESVGGGDIFSKRFKLTAEELVELAACFPEAARGVRHLHVSACSSDPVGEGAPWRAPFPELEDAWGYEQYCPEADKGCLAHLEAWELATRTPAQAVLSTALLRGMPYGEAVRLWRRGEESPVG